MKMGKCVLDYWQQDLVASIELEDNLKLVWPIL